MILIALRREDAYTEAAQSLMKAIGALGDFILWEDESSPPPGLAADAHRHILLPPFTPKHPLHVQWEVVVDDEADVAGAVPWLDAQATRYLPFNETPGHKAVEAILDAFGRDRNLLTITEDDGTIRPMRLNFIARTDCVSGYGEAGRHQALVLALGGAELNFIRVSSKSVVDARPEVDPLAALIFNMSRAHRPMEVADANIYHLCSDEAVRYREHVRSDAPHILAMAWETTYLPEKWVPQCNSFDACWAPTHWQREVMLDSGVTVPVHVVPFGLHPFLYPGCEDLGGGPFPGPIKPMQVEMHPAVKPHVDAGRRILLSIFQWSPRKGPDELIISFVRAFAGRKDHVLVLKAYSGDFDGGVAGEVEKVLRGFPEMDFPPIVVIEEHLSRAEMHALIACCDVYVTSTRGEGWCMPIHEAMLLGKPVIASALPALLEIYESSSAARFVNCHLSPVHGMPWIPQYELRQDWWICDFYDLIEKLKHSEHLFPAQTRDKTREWISIHRGWERVVDLANIALHANISDRRRS